jgi:predicted secreted protein
MGKYIITNAITKINSVDLTPFVQKVEVSLSKEKVDVTAMGASAKQYLPGLGDDSISVTFFQSFGASEVNATLQPLYASGSQFPIQVIPNGTAISSTNPAFSGTMSMYDYTPISGQVGDASTMDVEFTNAVAAGIVMATA